MTKATPQELWAAHSVGDNQTLWKAAVPLVRYVVKRLDVYGPHDREDLIAEGTLAAGVAIRAWNPIDVAFSTWICNCVRNRLIAYIDREREHDTRRVQQDVEQMAGDVPEPELDVSRVAEFLALVPFSDSRLLREHFGIGCPALSVTALAQKYEIPRSTVSDALDVALKNLREAMCAS